MDIFHPLLQYLDAIVQHDWFSWGDKVGFEGRKFKIRVWISPHTSWIGERGKGWKYNGLVCEAKGS